MTVVVVVARGVLAGVFAFSAWSKLRDRAATRSALQDMGLSSDLDRTLVVIEAFTALGLVMERRTAWAVYVACGLLVGFSALLVRELANGRNGGCACFGAISAHRPLTWVAVARNALLLAVAVLATGELDAPRWATGIGAIVTFAGFIAANAVAARAER